MTNKYSSISFSIAILLVLIILPGYSNAQITLTNNDLAPVNTTIYTGTDTICTGIAPGDPGENKTWDMSTLESHSNDVMEFIAPENTPYGDSFPFTNFSIYFQSDDAYAYLNRSDDKFAAKGIVGEYEDLGVLTGHIEPDFKCEGCHG